MRRLAVPLLIACAWSAGEVRLAASGVFSYVPVPGGRAELARVLDVPTLPERGRVVVELARMLYDSEPGKSPAADGRLARLSAHFSSALRSSSTESPSGGDTVPIPLTPAVWSNSILRR